MIVLTMPAPPTVNNLFLNIPGRGRVMSPRYRSWRKEAGWDVKSQRPGRIAGEYEMDVALPKGLTGDLGNYEKPISDLIVELGIVDDDRFCRRLSIASLRAREDYAASHAGPYDLGRHRQDGGARKCENRGAVTLRGAR
jgi:Holliday junction resolvase RusA-like endonuclease